MIRFLRSVVFWSFILRRFMACSRSTYIRSGGLSYTCARSVVVRLRVRRVTFCIWRSIISIVRCCVRFLRRWLWFCRISLFFCYRVIIIFEWFYSVCVGFESVGGYLSVVWLVYFFLFFVGILVIRIGVFGCMCLFRFCFDFCLYWRFCFMSRGRLEFG